MYELTIFFELTFFFLFVNKKRLSIGGSRRGSAPGFFGLESLVRRVIRGPLTSLGGTSKGSLERGHHTLLKKVYL